MKKQFAEARDRLAKLEAEREILIREARLYPAACAAVAADCSTVQDATVLRNPFVGPHGSFEVTLRVLVPVDAAKAAGIHGELDAVAIDLPATRYVGLSGTVDVSGVASKMSELARVGVG